MSFESKQDVVSGDSVVVMTEPGARVIRLEILSGHEIMPTTLNIDECDVLISVLKAARSMANIFHVGDL